MAPGEAGRAQTFLASRRGSVADGWPTRRAGALARGGLQAWLRCYAVVVWGAASRRLAQGSI